MTSQTRYVCPLLLVATLSTLVAADDPPNPSFDPELAHQMTLLQGPEPPLELLRNLTASATSDSGRRYNQVRQKASHNSFQKQEALLDQLIYQRVRSVEFDIHIGKSNWYTVLGNWYVYHADIFDADTTCHRLSDCFSELTAFDGTQPLHEVVTVWIDLKDGWSIFPGHQPADLDALINAFFPSSQLFRPSDLLASCPSANTLQQAVTTCGWPLLTSLQGKFIVVLTGGDADLDGYASWSSSVAESRAAFIAPSLSSGDYAKITARDYSVFFNINTSHVSIASDVNNQSFVSRVWKVNSGPQWTTAKNERAHHFATDEVNFHEEAWPRTHNSKGWPFECFSACSSSLEENVPLMGVEVNSEDIWGGSDHPIVAKNRPKSYSSGLL